MADVSRNDTPKIGYDRHLIKRLGHYLAPYKNQVVLSVALLLAISGLKVLGPYLTKVAIDQYIRVGDSDGLGTIAALFAGVLVVQFALNFVQTYLMNRTGQQIMSDIRAELFSHIQRLDIAYFDRTPVGRIITRVTNDVDVLNELFTSGVVTVFGDIFFLSGIVLAMLLLDWKLALVSFSVIPLLFLTSWVFKKRVRDAHRKVRRAVARINSFLQENITGIVVTQMFVQEERRFSEFKELNREHLDANLQSIRYYSIFYPLVNLIGAIAIALIFFFGGREVLVGGLSFGILVAFVQYSEQFFKPIRDLSEKFNILQSAMASAERIFEMLDTQPGIRTPSSPKTPSQLQGVLEFSQVSFFYKEGTPVLKNINFRVAAGEKLAIVGATGAGKSTIINLLCRFHDVQQGEIRFDGIDIRKLHPRFLRKNMAVVLQDEFLFSGTIEENIRLWGKGISDQQVQEAAQHVFADRFIQDLPSGFQSPVAERGVTLSAGQRQLVAFARALAHDPPILILDEATSSVDTETEVLIQQALESLLADRTALVVAHRLSTIRNCDRILVLHRGEIQEEGTHAELIQLKGLYYKLYRLQFRKPVIQTRNLAGEMVLGKAGLEG